MMIITCVLAVNSNTNLTLSKLTKLNTDLQTLDDRIAMYYVKNGDIPKYSSTVITKAELLGKLGNDISSDDGDKYYVIDLEQIDNLTLNYGENYKNATDDKYIINEETHKIYYLKGIAYDGRVYHTIGGSGSTVIPDESTPSQPDNPSKPDDGLEERFKENTKIPYVIN